MDHDSDRSIDEKIEITPEMIKAGDDVLGRNLIWIEASSGDFRREIVANIIKAALSVAPQVP